MSEESRTRADEARKHAERSLKELGKQLQAGNSEGLTAYLRAMSLFHRYSLANLLMILSQRPDATRVAGFVTWRSLGRQVRRGERGIAIFVPVRGRSKQAEGSDTEADAGAKPTLRPPLRFMVGFVYDVSQTDGRPLPTPAAVGGDPGQALAHLEAAVKSRGILLETVSDILVDGMSMGGRIRIRESLSPAERFSVIVHEWAHEILHQRDWESRPPTVVRETEAEATAFVVSQAIGLDTGTAAADYIRLYDGRWETLAASLCLIQQTACTIIVALEEQAKEQEVPEVSLGRVIPIARQVRQR